MSVNIQAQFKKDTRGNNGLDSIAQALMDEPHLRRVVVGVIETTRITEDVADGGVRTPTVNFVQIEPLSAEAAVDARRLLEEAYKARSNGGSVQPDLFDGPAGDKDEDGDE